MNLLGRRVPDAVSAAVDRLDQAKHRFTARDRATKLAALRLLAGHPIPKGALLLRFHEALCFLRAYPDAADLLGAVEDGLAGMSLRVVALTAGGRGKGLEAVREAGIAGTTLHSPLSFAAVRWLTARFPDLVEIDWDDPDSETSLGLLLPWVVGLAEEDVLVEVGVPGRAWLRVAKGADGRSDLTWLLSRLDASGKGGRVGRAVYDARELPIRWELRDTVASRTLATIPVPRVFFHRGPLLRWRGPLGRRLPGPRLAVRRAAGHEANALLDAARAAVLVRDREVHAFNFANPDDVVVSDAGRVVRIAWFGVLASHRLPLRAHYGYLLLKNGVPVGYGDASLLLDWVEIAFNIFETFRRGESAFIFVRLLGFLYQQFGVRAFHLSPYQLGLGNDEALESGAFWFYYKLGFRPKASDLARLAREERWRIARKPGYRSSRETLERLGTGGMFCAVGGGRSQASRGFDVRRVSLGALEEVARRGGSPDPATTTATAADRLDGVRWRAWPQRERVAFERLAPILAALPDLPRWPRRDRRALVEIARAKGGPREADYPRLMRAHRRLRGSLLRLGQTRVEVQSPPSSSASRSSSRPK